MENQLTEIGEQVADGRLARRTLLGVGIGGGLSLLPFLMGTASAEDPVEAPPRQPTDTDIELLAAAQQVELTARDLYQAAIDGGGFSGAEAALLMHIREAHEAYANAIAGALGRNAPGVRNDTLFGSLSGSFTGAGASVLSAMVALENTAVVTHADIMSRLVSTSAAGLVASVQVAEARHSTVLATLAGTTAVTELLSDGSATSLLEGN